MNLPGRSIPEVEIGIASGGHTDVGRNRTPTSTTKMILLMAKGMQTLAFQL